MESSKSYVPDEFSGTREKEDYALLVLDGIPGNQAGYFGLHSAEKQEFIGKELWIIGYPGHVRTQDKTNQLQMLSTQGRHQLWGMKTKSWYFYAGEDDEFHIGYDILTTPGQSGSGVFYQKEGTDEYYVIGVHIFGRTDKDSYNSATWLTKKRCRQITEWVGQSRRNLVSRYGEIESLHLSNHYFGDAGIEALTEFSLPKLRILNLSSSSISNTA